MHEASIAFEIYRIVDENIEKYQLVKVKSIYLKVGELNGIYENALSFAFKAISKGTKCATSEIYIEKVEGFELLVERIEGE